jgi:hypothetical protein
LQMQGMCGRGGCIGAYIRASRLDVHSKLRVEA